MPPTNRKLMLKKFPICTLGGVEAVVYLRKQIKLTAMKKTLKFDDEWKQAIALLPVKLQQQLIDAIVRYQQTGEVTPLPAISNAIFMLIKCTVDRRAASAARQRERRSKRSAAKNAVQPESQEEKTIRIGLQLKQNRRYLRSLSRSYGIPHADIKAGIDRVTKRLNHSGIEITDTETFLAYLLPDIGVA